MVAKTIAVSRVPSRDKGRLGSGGRTLDPAVFDAATLGSWNEKIRRPLPSAPTLGARQALPLFSDSDEALRIIFGLSNNLLGKISR